MSSIDLELLSKELFSRSVEAGFYDSLEMTEFNSQAKQLMMITSEVVEVMEALRKNKGEVEVMNEMADILIRLLDFYAALKTFGVIDSDLVECTLAKHEFNKSRPKMHGVLG